MTRAVAPVRRNQGGAYTTKHSTAGLMFAARQNAKLDGTERGVLYCHAADQFAGYMCTNAWALQTAYVYPTLSVDGGDPAVASGTTSGPRHWGCDNFKANLDDAWAYFNGGTTATSGTAGFGRSAVKNDKLAIIAGSMGALALKWASLNASKIAAFAAAIPAINLKDIHDNNKGSFAASIEASAGGVGNLTTAYYKAHSPLDDDAVNYIGFPILLFPSDDDPIAANTAACQAFAAAVNALGGDVTVVSIGAQGHNFTATNPNPDAFLDFIAPKLG